MADLGYTEVRPPSKLVAPGTILAIKSENPLLVEIVCTQTDAIGGAITVLESDTQNSTDAKALTGEFAINAKYLDKVNANVVATYIDGINVSLQNVKIQEIPHASVMRKISRYGTQDCKDAVAWLQEHKYHLSMISSSMQADYTYTILYKSGVDATAQAILTPQVAAGLGIKAENTGNSKIEGKNLFWGIRENVDLIAMAMLPASLVAAAPAPSAAKPAPPPPDPTPASAPPPPGSGGAERRPDKTSLPSGDSAEFIVLRKPYFE
ncbi:MAG: hypothetical protein JNM48_04960 [Rhodospirillales bacterium]|nr:hypothetical protein [Rhodospirillales bacterium]